VALHAAAPVIGEWLRYGTLYDAARGMPDQREYVGRGVAYGVPLGDGRVVVRHSRHGGLLAPVTRDLFIPPTRAPYELGVSRQLTAAGVPTPEIVAFAVYRALIGFRRADVVTREIAGARDLVEHEATEEASAAVETLLAALQKAGALHRDLNAKNILLAGGANGVLTAYVLDVDRVVFKADPDQANRARLRRSIEKLGLAFTI
jgi:3-deoxy-D-manno-octulosonic acid kinase